ncbi:hypothetical protein ABVF61_21375 [Roseibium sp. HPY-6]|uniref:hypothetical protein n=1 Tax=Roseibium sp. HPY-6 TaxID=3229852 RepID=UPI00338E7BC5
MKVSAILAAAMMTVSSAAVSSAATLSFLGAPDLSVTSVPSNFGVLEDVNGAVSRSAGFFRDTNGVLVLPANNDPFQFSVYNSTNDAGGLALDGEAKVTFTYLGFEAGRANSAASTTGFGGDSFVNKGAGASEFGDQIKDVFSSNVTPFLLDFFFSSSNSVTTEVADNDGTIDGDLTLAFGPIFNGGTSVFAFLGDGSGDDDFDDIVVRIDVAAVPIPAGLPLLVGGMGMLGYMGWRRKKATS